jgi:SpoVK/Ycf46/Vps4 family AAA+-type ATPase
VATAQQIVALLSSHVQGDEEQFLSIALQVAANEARRGHTQVAQELRKLVDAARQSNREPERDIAIPISRPKGELQSLLTVTYPKDRLQDLVLSQDVRTRLNRLVEQQLQRDKLHGYSQRPRTTLLLVGPPGSGKTLTGSALAGELRLPLFAIRLDALISRFMGETASKLRLIFDQIATTRGVYLFDEFDAIGGRRTADNDVGEMRRVLNSFLQFLEEPNNTDSVVIATTNHPDLLDRALFRRFDDIIEYVLPDRDAIRNLLATRLRSFVLSDIEWPGIQETAIGLSQADLARAAGEVAKGAILRDDDNLRVSTEDIIEALDERKAMRTIVSGIIDG